MGHVLYNWPSVSCKVRSQMVIHREHNYSIFSPADLKLERGLDVTQNLGGGPFATAPLRMGEEKDHAKTVCSLYKLFNALQVVKSYEV